MNDQTLYAFQMAALLAAKRQDGRGGSANTSKRPTRTRATITGARGGG